MLCSACYDNLVTYLNKFLDQKADVCLNKSQISTLLAVLQIHDTSNTRTGSEVLLDKFLSPEPSLWKFFTDFDGLCSTSFLHFGSVSVTFNHCDLLRLHNGVRPRVSHQWRNWAKPWIRIWKSYWCLHAKNWIGWTVFRVSSKFFFLSRKLAWSYPSFNLVKQQQR